MINEMKCTECRSTKIAAVEFDGYCFQCRDCGSMWNAEYIFYLARERDEKEKDQAKEVDTAVA